MKASDIMTTTIVTVSSNDTARHAAAMMARHHVSALPVLDQNGALVGIVSEGDLLHREETQTEKRRSWWLDLVTGQETRAKEYIKAFATHVRDVMTSDPVTVTETATLGEIANILESRHIKRVPVMRGSKVVGIVSRANLVQALASMPSLIVPDAKPDDATLRERVQAELRNQRWAAAGAINVVTHNGVVNLWGTVFSEAERQALRVMIERIPGVRCVEDHLVYYVPPAILM